MNHKSLTFQDHRPWPIPAGDWQWRQSWLELGFLHYRVSHEQLRTRIPGDLEIDQFDGSAWVSVVPFRMADVMRGNLPSVYPFKSFPELNLRTYVIHKDKPGVWFFSLDAASLPVVFGGRYLYGMPYFPATMSYVIDNNKHTFTSRRWRSNARFDADFTPSGEEFLAANGSFEHWVTERYCLYAKPWYRDVVRVEVHHRQWPMMHADFEIRENSLLQHAGIQPVSKEIIMHYSPGLEVVSYAPGRILSIETTLNPGNSFELSILKLEKETEKRLCAILAMKN